MDPICRDLISYITLIGQYPMNFNEYHASIQEIFRCHEDVLDSWTKAVYLIHTIIHDHQHDMIGRISDHIGYLSSVSPGIIYGLLWTAIRTNQPLAYQFLLDHIHTIRYPPLEPFFNTCRLNVDLLTEEMQLAVLDSM